MTSPQARSCDIRFYPTLLVGLIIAYFSLLCGNPEASAAPRAAASKRPQLVIDAKGLSGDPVVSVDISSDGRLVAAASGKEVRVWSLPDQRLYATLRGYREPGGFHGGTINIVKFLPRNHYLAVAVSDNTPQGSTRVFDLSHPDRIHQLLPGHKGCTRGLSVSPTGDYLVTYGCDFQFITYRRSHLGELWSIDHSTEWSHDTLKLTTLDERHRSPLDRVRRFDFVGSNDWFLATYDETISNPNSKAGPHRVPSGELLGDEASLLLLDVATRESPTTFGDWPQVIHDAVHRLSQLKLPSDPRSKFVEQTAQDLKIGGSPWYATTGKDRKSPQSGAANYWAASYLSEGPGDGVVYSGHRFTPSAVAISSDSRSTGGIVVSGDHLGEVHAWDGRNGQRIARFAPKVKRFYGVRMSPSGEFLEYSTRPYAAGDYGYNHFGPLTHSFSFSRRRASLLDSNVASNDSKGYRVSVRGGNRSYTVAVFNGELSYRSGNEWVSLFPRVDVHGVPFPAPRWIDRAHFGEVYCYAESPRRSSAGRPRVIIGSDKGGLEEYEIVSSPQSGKPVLACVRKFIGHTARVTGIDFSADGKVMASCAWDGTIRLWSLDNTAKNGDVDFFSDGTSVVGVLANSEAEKAGIRLGDVVTDFDGKPYFERLQGMASGQYQPGGLIDIRYLRRKDGEELTLADQHSGDESKYEKKAATIKLIEAPAYVEPYLSFFLSDDDEWVLFTKSGYYDASPRGESHIGWHINRDRHETALFYSVGQFRESLYRPDVIDKVLETHDESSALESAHVELAGIVEAPYPEVANAPTVQFLKPESAITTEAEQVELTFAVSYATADPVTSVDLRVGDRSSSSLPEAIKEVSEAGRTSITYRATVSPPAGDSFITATAISRTMTSAPARIEVRRPKRLDDKNSPRLYILAVGISDYAQSDLNLDWAAKDAADFVEAWKSQEGRYYASVEARLLTDRNATVDDLREGIGWLADRAEIRPYDVAIVYLAGHGLFSNRGRWYFGGHELDPNRLRTTAMPQSELVDLVNRDLTCRTLLFADTCHATGISETAGARQTHPQGRDPWLGMRCMSLVSCTARQQSVESDAWKNGAFTEAVLAALQSPQADIDRDGQLSFDELQLFVKRKTTQLAKTHGYEQTPAVQLPSFVSNVFLARSP